MRQYLVAIVLGCFIVSLPRAAPASHIAFDTAGDSAYNNGWTAGTNGGYGWGGGGWLIYANYGLPQQPPIAKMVADPALGGIMNSPAVAAGRAWAITDTLARRPLAGSLAVGQTISVELDRAGIEFHDITSAFGLVSDRGSDFMLSEVVFSIKGSLISYIDTGIPVINGPITVSLIMQNNESFTFDIRSLASPTTGGSYSFQFRTDPNEIWLDGGATVGYANNLSVTPEPSAFLLTGMAAFCLMRWPTRVRSGV